MCLSSSRHIRKGFTIMEVIVAVSILALLFSMLFPVLAAAKQVARRAQSSAHQGMIIQSMISYGNSNNHYFPGVDGRGRVLTDYYSLDSESRFYLSQVSGDLTDTDLENSGADVGVRYHIMLFNNYISREHIVSPGDRGGAYLQDPTRRSEYIYVAGRDPEVYPDMYSYALPAFGRNMRNISGSSPVAHLDPEQSGWNMRADNATLAVCDRNIGNAGPEERSIWTMRGRGWIGHATWMNGSTEFMRSSTVDTDYGRFSNQADRMFEAEDFGHAGSNGVSLYANVSMVMDYDPVNDCWGAFEGADGQSYR